MMLPVKKDNEATASRLDVNDALISLRQFGNLRLGFMVVGAHQSR